MIRKAVAAVFKRDGWLVPFIVLLVGVSEYWREAQITVSGLLLSALIVVAFLLMTKVPDEIRRIEAKREPL